MHSIGALEQFLSQYPVYEYRVIKTGQIPVVDRVRTVCREECERYGTTWACPPAVGELSACEKKIRSYPEALFFSSVSEVRDILDMKELLGTRKEHEKLTDLIGDFLKEEGYEIFILSTESCEICENCTYPQGKPCRFPERMHPCLESYGVVAANLAEEENMEYQLGGNTVLWFSLILFRDQADS